MSKELPQIGPSKTIYEGFFNVVEKTLTTEDQTLPYNFIELQGDAISVIAITEDMKFLINREWRPAVQKRLLATTGGLMHPNEKPLDAARRELLEETGYAADQILTLSTVYPFPGITEQKITYLLAKDAKKVQEPTLEEGEWIDTELLTKEELLKEIKDSNQVDGVFLAGLFLLQIEGSWLG